jgi:fatty acid desaturase
MHGNPNLTEAAGGAKIQNHAPAIAALKGLYSPNSFIYWCDLVGSAVAGWGAFAILCLVHNSVVAVAAGIAAIILLYRAYLFIHELSHAARRIGRFRAAWNVLAGFPLLVPSSFAVGVHTMHHNLHIYGTAEDPEYLPFARSRVLIVRFILLTLVFPLLMLVRFLLLGPVALLVPQLQRHLERHATSLAMNPHFVRNVGPEEHRALIREQIGTLGFWSPWLALLWTGVLPISVAMWWLVVATGISLINGVRSLAAHRYLGADPEFDRVGQFEDSIDTPGAWWTVIWAPVGHRYHALHHLAPSVPYHNLHIAYRRLVQAETALSASFEVSSSPSLAASLAWLWTSAGDPVRHGGQNV